MINKIYDTVWSKIKARRAYSNTMTTLNKLNGRELRDIGVARCDIPRLAQEAADKAKLRVLA